MLWTRGDRVLTSAELKMLGEAMRAVEAKGGNRMALTILRLLTFSGTQKTEITGLK